MTMQVIRPIFSVEALEQRKKAHDELLERIMNADCFDEIGGEMRPNKLFFRLLADAYGVNSEVIGEEREYVPCNPDVCAGTCTGNHYEVRFVVRATHRETGAHMDGDGSCIDNEKWPVRRKRLSKGQRELIYKVCAEKNVDDETKAQLAQRVSAGRASDLRLLNPQEASELIDFLFGNTPSLEPVLSVRNTRHNVRGTARTRAVNRAISDLVAGGIVSAEEIVRGHEFTDKRKPAQGNPASKTKPAQQPQAQKPTRDTRETPGAQHTSGSTAQRTDMRTAQRDFIVDLSNKLHLTGEKLAEVLEQITSTTRPAATRELDELTRKEASLVLDELLRRKAAA